MSELKEELSSLEKDIEALKVDVNALKEESNVAGLDDMKVDLADLRSEYNLYVVKTVGGEYHLLMSGRGETSTRQRCTKRESSKNSSRVWSGMRISALKHTAGWHVWESLEQMRIIFSTSTSTTNPLCPLLQKTRKNG